MDTPAAQSRPERVDRKGVMTYLPNEMAIRLKVYAARTPTTIQKIGEQAFTEFLAKYDSANAPKDSGGEKTESRPKAPTIKRSAKSSAKSSSSLKR